MTTPRRHLVPALVLSSLVVAGAARADGDHAVAECPQLFGDRSTRDDIAARQSSAVESITRARQKTTVVHHVGRWRKPSPLRLAGVSLVDVDRARGELALDVASDTFPGCPGGRYRVPMAIALGREDRVIALLDDAVLLERGRGVSLLVEDGHAPPVVELVWRSPYAIVRDVSASPASSSSSAAKRRDVKTADGVGATKPGAPEALRAATARDKPAKPKKSSSRAGKE